MVDRNSIAQDEADAAITAEEWSFAEKFMAMDDERFIQQGVAIFRAAEPIPTVNHAADQALEGLLKALVEGRPPEPAIFGAQRTAIAWRMYTAELTRRIASNQDVNFNAATETAPDVD